MAAGRIRQRSRLLSNGEPALPQGPQSASRGVIYRLTSAYPRRAKRIMRHAFGPCGELISLPQNLMPPTDNLPLSSFILTLVYTRGGAMLKSFIDGMANYK